MQNKIPYVIDRLFAKVMNKEEELQRIIDQSEETIMASDGTDMHEVSEAFTNGLRASNELYSLQKTIKYRTFNGLRSLLC